MAVTARGWAQLAVLAMTLGAATQAPAVVYLGDKSMESMIVKCEAVAVCEVQSTAGDQVVLLVSKSLKGELTGVVSVRGGKVTPKDRVLAFLKKDAQGQWRLEARLPLRSPVEEKVAVECYQQIEPFAGVLSDLADTKKDVDSEKLKAAVRDLAESGNAYVQIIMGRLMGGALATRVDAAPYTRQIAAGLKSKHVEYQKGACIWAATSKDRKLLEPLHEATQCGDAGVRELAHAAIRKIEAGSGD